MNKTNQFSVLKTLAKIFVVLVKIILFAVGSLGVLIAKIIDKISNELIKFS